MRRSLRRAIAYVLIRGLTAASLRLPRTLSLRLFSGLGVLAFYALRRDRNKTEINLALSLPELTRSEVRALGRNVWAALGRNCVDALRLPQMCWEEINGLVRIEGLGILEEALCRGKGVIAVTGHIGNWEMLGAYFSMRGYPLSVLARPLRDERLETLVDSMRRSKGIRPIPRTGSVKPAYESLRKGGMLGVLIDQDTPVKGVFCDFFGRSAFTPAGPAYLAMRTGAAIVPMGIHLQADGTHLVTVMDSIPHESCDTRDCQAPSESLEDSRARSITQSCTKAIEELIRREPSQWVWMHERWKTRPGERLSTVRGELECVV